MMHATVHNTCIKNSTTFDSTLAIWNQNQNVTLRDRHVCYIYAIHHGVQAKQYTSGYYVITFLLVNLKGQPSPGF